MILFYSEMLSWLMHVITEVFVNILMRITRTVLSLAKLQSVMEGYIERVE